MKVDGLGVVLAIILLPIILVVTYYIQLQVDTIATENSYNTKLLNATYDAMSAFEINTANEKLSSVADSMRSIVEASNNVLIDSLATKLGISNASKENLKPYIPAVLYTMYDGYYIYAPTKVPMVAEHKKTESAESGDALTITNGYWAVGDKPEDEEDPLTNIDGVNTAVYGDVIYEKDGGGYTVKKENAKQKTDYILKPYVQYSARYVKDDSTPKIDVTINYTLDNYLNIVGTIGDVYYTKTGYLIKKDLVNNNVTLDDQPVNLENYNEDDVKEKILGKKTNAEETTIPAARSVTVTVNGQAIIANWPNVDVKTVSELEEWIEKNPNDGQYNDVVYAVQQYKACAYYASAACFSNWVYENLGSLQYKDIVDKAMTDYYTNANYKPTSGLNSDIYYSFAENETLIFDGDPEDTESNFNTHRIEVIKNSIKYNLNLAISSYCSMRSEFKDVTAYDFSLPVILDEEWDKILSNISIVSFMQGWDCGLKIYNNYEMVSSTNNELTVTPSEIYYVEKSKFNNNTDSYHRIDCPYLEPNNDIMEYISFKSKEVKYDKVYDKASGKNRYDHRNLACYTCINSNSYESFFKPKDDQWYENSKKYTSYYDRISSLENVNLRKAGYVGLAKERQNIYKTNALPVSEGYKIIYDDNIATTNNKTLAVSKINLGNVKKIQITFSETKSKNTAGNKEPILKLNATIGTQSFNNIVLNLDQTKEQTIILEIPASVSEEEITQIKLEKTAPSYDVEYKVKSIKAIYK